MTAVDQVFPTRTAVDPGTLVRDAGLVADAGGLVPGDERVLAFFSAVSRPLLRPALARRHPELAALGFFLRPSQLSHALTTSTPAGTLARVPRGLVLHLAPANVPTLFCYAWALSALAGNRNVVRLSSRPSPVADQLLDVLRDAAPVLGAVARTQLLVRYARDDAATATLSLACDLRVLWGGDSAVTAIRQHPLRPSARDLAFPNRSSFTVFSAQGWLASTPQTRGEAARALWDDAWWFDQAACSSPLTIFWVGKPAETRRSRADLTEALAAEVIARPPRPDAAMAVRRRAACYGLAITGAARSITFAGSELTMVDLTGPEHMPRTWLGAGVFAVASVTSLNALVPLADGGHQTVTHFGFTAADIIGFAAEVTSRGVDRVVPVGQALHFDAIWDGIDLMAEFTRLARIRPRPEERGSHAHP